MESSKDTLKKGIMAVLEIVDDKIPFVGPIMDIPIIDKLEEELVGCMVDMVCDASHEYGPMSFDLPWSA